MKFLLQTALFFLISIFKLSTVLANQNPETDIQTDSPGILFSKGEQSLFLAGKIVGGRYYSPDNSFSCMATEFLTESYSVQDFALDNVANVLFYNSKGDFQRAIVTFVPALSTPEFSIKTLKYISDNFRKKMLEKTNNDETLKILSEETLGEDAFFLAFSAEKTIATASSHGETLAALRGALIFQEKGRVVTLIINLMNPSDGEQDPKILIEPLKKGIIAFRNSFEFEDASSSQ